MDFLQSIVLGVVQGLTEFLPISSTAHLRIVPALAGWRDPGAAYSAVVQIGTLLAVLVYFYRDLVTLAVAWAKGLVSKKPFEDPYSRLAWMIAAGTLPIGVCGLWFQDAIESTLRSLWVVSFALIGLAVVLGLAELVGSRRKSLSQIGWVGGVFIGCMQALALIPGASRSGVTITAGLFAGLKRADAARFSFLLSVPAVAASGLYELMHLAESGVGSVMWSSIIVATLTAFGSGYLAIAGLIHFLKKRSTLVFIAYRLILGVLIIVLMKNEIISPY